MRTRRFVARSFMPATAEQLYSWHLRPGAFERLAPPWQRLRVLERTGAIADGARVVLQLPAGPLSIRWVARHTDFVCGRRFRDVQEQGPFARWVHTHSFLPDGAGRSLLEDEIEYAFRLGAAGRLVGGRCAQRRLERIFAYRHAVTAGDLERHREWAGRPPLQVAISGASGLVGSALSAFLESGGHGVHRLVRREPARAGEIFWDTASGRIEASKLEGLDAVVHLAGENIAAGRWTARQKARIRDSRVEGTRLVAETLAVLERPPRVLISASAIGYYGDRGEEELDEGSDAGTGFLAETCRLWESAVGPAEGAGIRVVRLRIGVVLTPVGGALRPMLLPFRLGLGGRLGSGRQFVSWIAHDDLIGAIHRALVDDGLCGVVNAVAPAPVRQAELAQTLGSVLGRPTLFPIPAAALRIALGEMGEELLLASAKVLPQQLTRTGFRFRHPDLERALRFTLGRAADEGDRPEFSFA